MSSLPKAENELRKQRMNAQEFAFEAPINFEKLSDFKKGSLGMVGKLLRLILNEDYLNCDCTTCKHLQKLHERTQKGVEFMAAITKNPQQSVQSEAKKQ